MRGRHSAWVAAESLIHKQEAEKGAWEWNGRLKPQSPLPYDTSLPTKPRLLIISNWEPDIQIYEEPAGAILIQATVSYLLSMRSMYYIFSCCYKFIMHFYILFHMYIT